VMGRISPAVYKIDKRGFIDHIHVDRLKRVKQLDGLASTRRYERMVGRMANDLGRAVVLEPVLQPRLPEVGDVAPVLGPAAGEAPGAPLAAAVPPAPVPAPVAALGAPLPAAVPVAPAHAAEGPGPPPGALEAAAALPPEEAAIPVGDAPLLGMAPRSPVPVVVNQARTQRRPGTRVPAVTGDAASPPLGAMTRARASRLATEVVGTAALMLSDVEGDQRLSEEDVFTVERIVDERERVGVTQFKVRWQGFDSRHDQWLDEGEVQCPGLVRYFRAQRAFRVGFRVGMRGKA
jgi:hypothetical protein